MKAKLLLKWEGGGALNVMFERKAKKFQIWSQSYKIYLVLIKSKLVLNFMTVYCFNSDCKLNVLSKLKQIEPSRNY